jgi:hypothetical protein
MKLNFLSQNPPAPIAFIINAINAIMNGASNSIGTVTLTNNGTTTTLQNNLITSQSVIFLAPQTAHASTVTGIWCDPTSVPVSGSILGGQITINHSAVAQADLTFGYEIRN